MAEQVQEYKLEKIPLEKIDFDDTNPNEMSDEQSAALDKAMKKFGFLAPIIVSTKKSGRYSMVDGEHRAKKYQEYGKTHIMGYALNLSKVDKKILRQVMNKLRGTHDPEKDAMEYQFIESKNKLEMLASLIAQPAEQLVIESPSVEISKDKEMIQHHEDTFLHGNLKQLYFVFTNDQYEELMPRIDKIREHCGVDNNTDMFMKMVETYEDTHLKA